MNVKVPFSNCQAVDNAEKQLNLSKLLATKNIQSHNPMINLRKSRYTSPAF